MKKMITESIKRITVGAGLIGLLSLGVACENTAGGDYNRTIEMPTGCQEVISAGYSNSTTSQGYCSNWDWLSCKDQQGNITIYRMNKGDTVWYKTEIRKSD